MADIQKKQFIKMMKMAQEIKSRFEESGIVDYEIKEKLEAIAYKYEICVYFDDDDIPEQIEDEPV